MGGLVDPAAPRLLASHAPTHHYPVAGSGTTRSSLSLPLSQYPSAAVVQSVIGCHRVPQSACQCRRVPHSASQCPQLYPSNPSTLTPVPLPQYPFQAPLPKYPDNTWPNSTLRAHTNTFISTSLPQSRPACRQACHILALLVPPPFSLPSGWV